MNVRIASALELGPDPGVAASLAAERVAASLGETPDLAFVFCSPQHQDHAGTISACVTEGLGPRHLLGCTGESIVGDGREVESDPAVSLWAAVLPGAGFDVFHGRFFRDDNRAGFAGIPDLALGSDIRAVILLADPFSFPADALLRYSADRFPGTTFVGGMASGGLQAGTNRLFLDGEVHTQGAVGVALSGAVPVRTMVSQGCRPMGKPFVVTRAEGTRIWELAGRPAFEQLQHVLTDATEQERERASQGLHIGIVIDEYKEAFERGDFLIRGVFRADPQEGWIEVGDIVDVGRTIQFQVRDARSADEDLRDMLGDLGPAPSGALLFTCNGRGSRMFSTPDHDVAAIRETVGDLPVAGFFCQGEIGPVGGQSFLHGFTASAAFFG